MINETKLILELCKFKQPNKERIKMLLKESRDLPYVLGQLLYNRVGGVAYSVLRECGLFGSLNREFRNTLDTIYHANVEKTLSIRIVADSLNMELERLEVPYAFLKGALLCFEYPLGCRTSNDIDILINSEDIDKVSKALIENEYEQGYLKNGVFTKASRSEIISSRMLRGETVPFVKKIEFPGVDFSEVDINFSLDYKSDHKYVVRKILSGGTVYKNGICSVRTLDKYDFLIHLCSHLYKEATVYPWVRMGRDLSLYKFLDIYALTYEWTAEDCVRFLRHVDKYELYRECYYSLVYVNALFGLKDSVYDAMKKLSFDVDETNVMNTVISPADKKKYKYKSSDLTNRVFNSGRILDLDEVIADDR